MHPAYLTISGLFSGLGVSAPAAAITVISGAAIEPGLNAAAIAFEKQSGIGVEITYNTTPQIRRRVAAGDTFDILIAPPAAIADFAQAGKVEKKGVDLGRVGAGVAVRPGAPLPKIDTTDNLRQALLEAESIVFNRASSGIYLESLFKKMGLWEQIEPKATRYATGAEVMDHVLNGRGREFGFGPTTEILIEKDRGLVLVGPLPAEIQNYTAYTAVLMSAGRQKEAAQAFTGFLDGPEGKSLFAASGIE